MTNGRLGKGRGEGEGVQGGSAAATALAACTRRPSTRWRTFTQVVTHLCRAWIRLTGNPLMPHADSRRQREWGVTGAEACSAGDVYIGEAIDACRSA